MSLCPIPATITITPRAPPTNAKASCKYFWMVVFWIQAVFSWFDMGMIVDIFYDSGNLPFIQISLRVVKR